MTKLRQLRRKSLRVVFAGIVLLVPMAILQAAQDSQPAAGTGSVQSLAGSTGKHESATPGLVKKQQAEYQRLRDEAWNKRELAPGLPAPEAMPTARDSNVGAVGISVRNVDLYLGHGIGYHVVRLEGALVPVAQGEPVNFDKPDSFRIHIFSGEVLIRPAHLDALFNNYLLVGAPRALSQVENTTTTNALKVSLGARLFKVLPPVGGMPTTLSGPIKVNKAKQLVYTPETVKSLGVPLKPLLSGVGLKLATITPFKRPGIVLQGNQLVMDAEKLFPPPQLKIEKISNAVLDERGLTLTFSSGVNINETRQPPTAAKSSIWLHSGDARFYNVVLVNSSLQLLPEGDAPLQFHLYDYRAQTASGTIRMRADGTLLVRVPNDFKRSIDDTPQQITNASPRDARQK